MAVVFSKVLCNTDVTTRLEVPSKALQYFHFPPGERTLNLIAKDPQNNDWEFCLSKRNEGYAKPSLRGAAWIRYVRVKGLERGDEVMFSAMPINEAAAADQVQIRIVAKKYVKLFGRVIGVKYA